MIDELHEDNREYTSSSVDLAKKLDAANSRLTRSSSALNFSKNTRSSEIKRDQAHARAGGHGGVRTPKG